MTSRDDLRASAIVAWQALDRAGIRARRRGTSVREPRTRRAVPLWPFGQVLHAAVATAPYDGSARERRERLWIALEDYRCEEAYAERPGNRTRYYDDDAWIALAAVADGRDAPLAVARRVCGWLATGVREGGGVLWVEGGTTLNACSTGGTGLAAARLAALLPQGAERDGLERLGDGCLGFLLDLLDDEGMVADHRRADRSVDRRVFAYNQGLLVGLLLARGRLDAAVEHARRTARVLAPERLWQQPAAFAAILVRELAVLLRTEPDPVVAAYASGWAERVLREARDPRTGLLVSGGIGRYDGGVLIDHAAVVTALAALGD